MLIGIVCVFSLALISVLAILYIRASKEISKVQSCLAAETNTGNVLRARLRGITDIEAEISATKGKLAEANSELNKFVAQDEIRRKQLAEQFEQGKKTYDELKHEIGLLEENLEDISFGLYKPHFTYQTSEEYKAALQKLRERERDLIRQGRAATCRTTWTVGNSEADGKRMTKQYLKLLLRAFNGECDAAVSNVTWNNVTKMEERIKKSCEALNETGTVMQMCITAEYRDTKLDELRLTHEYENKRYEEKEAARRAREEMREQEKAEREAEKAREEAEKSEAEYQKLLAKARQEALESTGAQLEKLNQQINSFEAKLDEARKKKERAIARAQLTKSGFVYVISNIGAFGENVFKIGMTRRMEPMDRVDELGDASVPFPYDLHVMFFSDNAPELESALHQLFEDRRVNLVNPRREFYANVKLEEIEEFVRARGLSAQIIKIPEAREYRESVALRAQKTAVPVPEEKFSKELFVSAAKAQA